MQEGSGAAAIQALILSSKVLSVHGNSAGLGGYVVVILRLPNLVYIGLYTLGTHVSTPFQAMSFKCGMMRASLRM